MFVVFSKRLFSSTIGTFGHFLVQTMKVNGDQMFVLNHNDIHCMEKNRNILKNNVFCVPLEKVGFGMT